MVTFLCVTCLHVDFYLLQVKAYGQVPETIPDEDACSSALNLLRMIKDKRMKENQKKKVEGIDEIWMNMEHGTFYPVSH